MGAGVAAGCPTRCQRQGLCAGIQHCWAVRPGLQVQCPAAAGTDPCHAVAGAPTPQIERDGNCAVPLQVVSGDGVAVGVLPCSRLWCLQGTLSLR